MRRSGSGAQRAISDRSNSSARATIGFISILASLLGKPACRCWATGKRARAEPRLSTTVGPPVAAIVARGPIGVVELTALFRMREHPGRPMAVGLGHDMPTRVQLALRFRIRSQGGRRKGSEQRCGEDNLLHERPPIWSGLLTERLQPAGHLSD